MPEESGTSVGRLDLEAPLFTMIISKTNGSLRLIQQVDHARFAGELAALWVRGDLVSHPRRAEILFAIRQHDNGWNEIDSAPLCNPRTGQPIGFAEMPLDRRLEIWRLGPSRYARARPYSALLILRHAIELHRQEALDERWRSLLVSWSELEQELLDETKVDPEEVDRDYRWLRRVDQISLAVCAADPTLVSRTGTGVRVELSHGGPLQLDALIEPFPLAGGTSFDVGCRSIPARHYSGDSDLASTLAATRWQKMRVRVVSLL